MESQQQHLANLISKLEGLVDRFEKAQGGATSGAQQASAPKAAATGSSQSSGLLKDFDNSVSSKIKAFEDASAAIGGDIIPVIVRYKNIAHIIIADW
jgi:predicted dinucleotide-binding enzyme